jgi:hypothetical protein
MSATTTPEQSSVEDPNEVLQVARGIATAVAPPEGLTDVQALLLQAIASALTGVEINYQSLEPLGPEDLAAVIGDKPLDYRQRIVHHMVLAELVLRPLPMEVAARVAKYANALEIEDKFVRVARRYAQGAFGLAWMDLQRSGFTQHLQQSDLRQLHGSLDPNAPFEAPAPDPGLESCWQSFEALPAGSLGRSVWEMYDVRGFALPGTADGPNGYLAQHDFVHVIADYGTNLKGEIEVFAFIGRADPDPKGFAWLATLIGLFETGFIKDTGFFVKDLHHHDIRTPGMHHRLADAIRRGKQVCQAFDKDLFDIDYHPLAGRPVEEVREILRLPAKSEMALESGSAGLSERDGMSEIQQRYADEHGKLEGGS